MDGTRPLKVGAVVKQCRVTRRQLRYWEEIGLIGSRRVGSHRAYGPVEVERVKIVRALVRGGGVPPRTLAHYLRSNGAGVEGWTDDEDEREDDRRQYRRMLAETADRGKTLQFDVSGGFQAYNTLYKRLRRQAASMSLGIRMKKTGDTLTVKVRRPREVERDL